MYIFVIIISILFILAFIPFPIKLGFIYAEDDEYFFIFNKKINIKPTRLKVKKTGNVNYKVKLSTRYDLFRGKINVITARRILRLLKRNKAKPSLNLDIQVNYGLDDAALTAISYGILNMVPPLIYQVTNTIFDTSTFNCNIVPMFNKKFIKLKIKSIIWISVAKAIYIAWLVIKGIFTKRN
ncbi:MAG: DUF2953 domain-containing protein [Bacillota bacterium]|nr:DUF2953 domain-containing protein [Bacillota bacterium]